MTEIGVDTLKKKNNYLTNTSIKHVLIVLTIFILLFSLIACQSSDKSLDITSENMQWEIVDSDEDIVDEDSQDTTLYFGEYEEKLETEALAQGLYDTLYNIRRVDDLGIEYIQLQYDNPISIGQSDNGIFEYVIELTIYYKI